MGGDFTKSDFDKSDQSTEFNIGKIVEKSNNSFQHLYHDFLVKLFQEIGKHAEQGEYTMTLRPTQTPRRKYVRALETIFPEWLAARNNNSPGLANSNGDSYSQYRNLPTIPPNDHVITYLQQSGFQVKEKRSHTEDKRYLEIAWGLSKPRNTVNTLERTAKERLLGRQGGD